MGIQGGKDKLYKPTAREKYKASHSPEQIANRLQDGPASIYLKDFIYGAIDGAVTTFAVVAGVAGAGLSSGIVIVLGFANLLADGFSMAVSNFMGTRADNQYRKKMRNIEQEEIKYWPQGEIEEIRQIYAAKGFKGELLEQIVEVITAEEDRWVDTMIQEEHGMPLEDHSPAKAGLITFIAFFVIGLVPLLTYLVNWLAGEKVLDEFLWSTVLTGLAFLGVGAAKARFLDQSHLWAAFETLLIGGAAAALAFGVGVMLKGLTL